MHTAPVPDQGASCVEAREVHLALEGVPILRGVNLRVPAGQLVALIGPNGSGKTTLLRALLGFQKIDHGEIKLFGQADVVAALPRIGYVPQRFNLERSFILSVREFLALRLRATRHWFWQTHRCAHPLIAGRNGCRGAAGPAAGPAFGRPVATRPDRVQSAAKTGTAAAR